MVILLYLILLSWKLYFAYSPRVEITQIHTVILPFPFFLCIYPLLPAPLKINSVQLFVLKASSWKIPHTFLNCKHQKVFSQMFVGKKSQINTSSLMTLIEALKRILPPLSVSSCCCSCLVCGTLLTPCLWLHPNFLVLLFILLLSVICSHIIGFYSYSKSWVIWLEDA